MIGVLVVLGAVAGAGIGTAILLGFINLYESFARWRLVQGEQYDADHKICPKDEEGYHSWEFDAGGLFGPKVCCKKCGEHIRGRIF